MMILILKLFPDLLLSHAINKTGSRAIVPASCFQDEITPCFYYTMDSILKTEVYNFA